MTKFDVLTVGNAIVDIISRCEEDFLVGNAITKGAMNLIDAERAEKLYALMGPAVEASGGSAGNTAAGVANFGGRAAYFGKVADESLYAGSMMKEFSNRAATTATSASAVPSASRKSRIAPILPAACHRSRHATISAPAPVKRPATRMYPMPTGRSSMTVNAVRSPRVRASVSGRPCPAASRINGRR